MKAPSFRAITVGELSTWGEQFIKVIQEKEIATIEFQRTADRFLESDPGKTTNIIFVENHKNSRETIDKLRLSNRRVFILWIGENFSKEDLSFAIENRVYAVLENEPGDSQRVVHALLKAAHLLQDERNFDLLVRSIKATLVQAEGDIAPSLMSEVRSAVGKLGEAGVQNEFVRGGDQGSDRTEAQVFFHRSEDLSDALLTIDNLERTGVLWVRVESQELEGRIDFLQGKIISAQVGEVHGLKAIYRMYLWDEPKFLFARREHDECVLDEQLNVSMKYITMEGEEQRRRFENVRRNVPPNHLVLQLVPDSMMVSTALQPNVFDTLASVVEFGRVENVLNYSDLNDMEIYESLIELRKDNLITVSA